MQFRQPITDLQDQILKRIYSNNEIVRALIIGNEDFISRTPTTEQQSLIDNPKLLIRKQIFPYKKVTLAKDKNAKPYITSAWVDFRKDGSTYQSGKVYFYIIVPENIEKTAYGIRYNFIADKLDEIFCEKGIGEIEYYSRGDFDVVTDGYLGHHISFNILNFHINESGCYG